MTVFTVQPDLSKVTLAADVLGVTLTRQSAGSLLARYEGAIVTDVTDTGIQFLGGSDAAPETRGKFDPGNAPANYAGEATQLGVNIANAAIRGMKLDFTSAVTPVDANSNFPSNAIHVHTTAGSFAYDVVNNPEGSFNLAGQDAVNSITTPSSVLALANGTFRLTIPLDVTFNYSNPSAKLRLTGQIVGIAGTDRGLRPRLDANGLEFGTGHRAVFTTGETAAPVAVVDATGLTVADNDSPALTGATAVLDIVPDQPNEVLAVDTTGTPISAMYDAATGTLSMTGNATPAQYQQVLRTLTYNNTGTAPTFGTRTVNVTVSDEVGPGAVAANTVSVQEPFNINVARLGTDAGPTGGRTVTFADADGTISTITIVGGGTAFVRFQGAATQTLSRGAIRITGPAVSIDEIDVTGSNALSRLSVRTAGGNKTIDVGRISSDGPLFSVGGKGVNLTGDMDVNGRVTKAVFNNVTGADVTAGSVLKMTLTGSMLDSTLTLEDPYAPLVPVLGSLSVRGAITNSRVSTTGNIGSVKAGGLVNSEVYAGVVGTDRFPSVSSDFGNEASILKLTLRGPLGTASFDNSVVAANNLGRINLGLIDTDNAAAPFGVAADTIATLSGTNALGERLRLIRLDDPAVLAAALPTVPFTFGDYQIHLV
jgi:hypothetical protein